MLSFSRDKASVTVTQLLEFGVLHCAVCQSLTVNIHGIYGIFGKCHTGAWVANYRFKIWESVMILNSYTHYGGHVTMYSCQNYFKTSWQKEHL